MLLKGSAHTGFYFQIAFCSVFNHVVHHVMMLDSSVLLV